MNRHEKYFWGWGGAGEIMRFWFREAHGNALAVCCGVLRSGYADRDNQTLQRNPLKLLAPFKETSSNDSMVSVPFVYSLYYFTMAYSLQWARATSIFRFLDQTQRRTTVGTTPLDEWSARRRDPYLTKHNTHNRQTPTSPVGFEPAIPAIKRPQTHTSDRAVARIGDYVS